MKILPHLAFLAGCALAGGALVLATGCNKPEAGSPKSPVVSAEKTSFNEVTAHLDPGGSFYMYLGTEQWLNGLAGKVSEWKEFFGALPDIKAEDQVKISKAFQIVTNLIKDSGIEDVSGFGMSSIAPEKGMHHVKTLLYHYPGKGSGFLWTLFGRQQHELTGLNLLPTNTAVTVFSDLDIPLLWSVIQKEVRQADLPEVEQFLEKVPAAFEKATNMKWDQVLASLGGEYGLVLTLDESKMIPVPLPGNDEPLQVPEPALMIILKVKDDAIFNRVDAALKQTGQQIVQVDKDNLKMRTLPLPLPLPIQLRPSIAASDGYLFIASTDAVIQDALAVKAGQKPGLKTTAEFKRLAAGVPAQGNQFCFVSRRFGETFLQVQKQAIRMNGKLPAGQREWLESLLQPNKAKFAYTVSGNTDEGWISVSNSN